MYTRSFNAQITAYTWTIMSWGMAGVLMVGLPAAFMVDEDRLGGFFTLGLVSFMVLRGFLVWCEYRDAKQGF